MAPDDSEKLVLSVAEVRKKLGLSKGSIYEAVRNGQIPSIRFGRRILIPVASLHRLLEDPKALNLTPTPKTGMLKVESGECGNGDERHISHE